MANRTSAYVKPNAKIYAIRNGEAVHVYTVVTVLKHGYRVIDAASGNPVDDLWSWEVNKCPKLGLVLAAN